MNGFMDCFTRGLVDIHTLGNEFFVTIQGLFEQPTVLWSIVFVEHSHTYSTLQIEKKDLRPLKNSSPASTCKTLTRSVATAL